ncbi:MAG: RdgB/HAM1 family non-canonical purine NTP pyrophosphatase [Anaerolineaceae bacterium]|nr:RdgB/HAM1 family non-canonical purine NTP pyrophosphatase [Anaerolineaceae bacterium]
MTGKKQLLLGTNNPGKIQELSALLAGLQLELITPRTLGVELSIEEQGTSYMENAIHKALTWSRLSSLPALADDSGLEVDALSGAPGLLSHRFTGNPNACDDERRHMLLDKLQLFQRPWFACFIRAVAIASPGQEMITATGYCHGEIIPEERGTNGFGYDPIFLVYPTGKTMAELSMAHKNRVSHRAKALLTARQKLIEQLHVKSRITR